ncbi:MAG: acyl carrier protein [Acidimicrobiales bacterium]
MSALSPNRSQQDVERAVRQALEHVAPEIDFDGIDLDAELIEGVDLDSMDFLNVVTALDELLGVSVPERDYPRLHTLRAMIDYLVSHG